MIYKRRSARAYTGAADSEKISKIEAFYDKLKPLYPNIRVCFEIVQRESVKCILPWLPPQLIGVYSEDAEGALENVGFMLQQLELYIHTLGLGACWLGMGKIDRDTVKERGDGLRFVMLLAFGEPKGELLRRGKAEFKRNSLANISDVEDVRLEPARYAPSSINSQPWYFTHEGDTIHAYCVKRGLPGLKALGDMNRMDMGIALAHMYVSNEKTFRFFKVDEPKPLKGYGYTGSFTI